MNKGFTTSQPLSQPSSQGKENHPLGGKTRSRSCAPRAVGMVRKDALKRGRKHRNSADAAKTDEDDDMLVSSGDDRRGSNFDFDRVPWIAAGEDVMTRS